MTMESPVRIYLSAAIVVHLLLLGSTVVIGNALPNETEAPDSFEEYLKSENHASFILNLNKTFNLSKRPKREATTQVDVALKESNHREPQISEKHSDNNTKSRTEAHDSFEEYLNSENHTSFILNLNKTFQLISKRPKREATTQVDVALNESNHREPQISEKHSENNTKSRTEAHDSFEEYLNSENHTSFILNLNKTFQLISKRPKREATTQVDVALNESNHREPQISEKHSENNTKSRTEAHDSFEEYLNSENHTSFILNLNKTFQLISKRPKREATTQVDVALNESNHREPQISEKHSENNTKSRTEAHDSFEEYLNSENHTSFILNLNKTFQLISKRPKREATRQVDVALNELNPREPEISEEHSEKNAKSRGRVRFHSQLKSSTESSFKRITSRTTTDASTSDPSKVVIVTPTPDVKKPAQIIDSMRTYKKIKMPAVTSSSTNPTLELAESASNENDEEQDNNSNEKPTTANVRVNNSFAVPNYTKKSIRRDSRRRDGARNKVKSESFGPDSYFSSENSFERNKFKSDTYFNFESDLTTPKNDFFDKKYSEIQHSIVKNLESVQSKSPNMTNVRKIIKKNIGHENFNNRSPKNKSSLYFKNTKEIQISDNEKAGTSNKELSDVQGTSIYYEMSVLSTETYAINNLNDDDDCDESAPESTVSTSVEQELAAIDTNQEAPVSNKSKVQAIDSKAEPINSLASNYLPFPGNVPDVYNPITPLSYSTLGPISTQNYVSSTEKSNLSNRSKTPKRLNFTGTKESPNSFTTKPNAVPTRNSRPSSRRFHYTTPKIKPIWMAPRRNLTRTFSRSTLPTTIYQEYFDIKDKYTTTTKPKDTNKSTLSTVSSDIDPVQQSDVSGIKKVVHSNSISENSIPSLWKRGSTKFSTSTASSSTETDSGVSEMEIPPTLTAWALASLRSPPSMSTSGLNVTSTTPKSVDDDDLQNVGEVTDKKEPSTRIAATSSNMLNSDVVTSKVEEMDQNRLSWHQIFAPSVSVESQAEVQTNDSSINKLPDRPFKDSHSDQSISNEGTINTDLFGNLKALTEKEESEETEEIIKDEEASKANKTLDVQNIIGFESITKLPAEVTTPPDDFDSNNTPVESSNKLSTYTDYEITTIRFSYKPTEEPMTEEFETTTWYATPTRTKTTIMDGPITTYRPKYVTTTDVPLDTSTVVTETTTVLVTSESYEQETEPTTTISEEVKEPSTTMTSEIETTTMNTIVVETTALPETKEEITSTVVDIVTEINKSILPQESTTASTDSPSEPTETPLDETSQSYENYSSSEENNEVITQETLKPSSTTSSSTGASTTFITTTAEMTTKLNTETEEPKPIVTTITSIEAEVPTTETQKHANITTTVEQPDEVTMDVTTDVTTKSVSSLEDLTSYGGEVTTESSSRVLTEEAGSGAAIAIAVSTIGVIALILLVGLLLVVRRRGRRGAYAHRCTPVSLDAYSLDSVSVGHRKGQRIRASKRSYGNPAYDDEVTSHPMQYAALANFALDIDSMTAEFAEIPTVTVRPDEVPPGCEDKNRYSNVLPLPETRVPLARIGNDPTTEYINANYITGPGNIRNYYIACQAPLASTVADFWRMVWEQNSRVIVMLTEYMENGVEKCYEYLPPSEISDNRRTFGEYQIILKKREQKDKYAVSSVQLINLTTRTWREITHLWYFWPAKGVPDDYDSVIDFLSEMRGYMKISQAAKEYDEDGVEVIYEDENRSSFQNLSKFRSDDSSSVNGVNVYSPAKAEEQLKRHGNGTLSRMKAASEVQAVRPCVVVCASGAGRSAALVAADICARALAAGQVDVPRVVRELRAQRPHSLANRHHYILLYKVLSEYGNKMMGGGVDTI